MPNAKVPRPKSSQIAATSLLKYCIPKLPDGTLLCPPIPPKVWKPIPSAPIAKVPKPNFQSHARLRAHHIFSRPQLCTELLTPLHSCVALLLVGTRTASFSFCRAFDTPVCHKKTCPQILLWFTRLVGTMLATGFRQIAQKSAGHGNTEEAKPPQRKGSRRHLGASPLCICDIYLSISIYNSTIARVSAMKRPRLVTKTQLISNVTRPTWRRSSTPRAQSWRHAKNCPKISQKERAWGACGSTKINPLPFCVKS